MGTFTAMVSTKTPTTKSALPMPRKVAWDSSVVNGAVPASSRHNTVVPPKTSPKSGLRMVELIVCIAVMPSAAGRRRRAGITLVEKANNRPATRAQPTAAATVPATIRSSIIGRSSARALGSAGGDEAAGNVAGGAHGGPSTGVPTARRAELRPCSRRARARATIAAMEHTARTMFQATHGPSVSLRTRATSAMRSGFAWSIS